MLGLFWNCRGAGKKGMSTCLTDMISAHEVDFLGLQETMKSNYTPSFFRKLDPLQKFYWEWNPSRGESRGILCGINKNKFDILYYIHLFSCQCTIFWNLKRKTQRLDLFRKIGYTQPCEGLNVELFASIFHSWEGLPILSFFDVKL